MTRTTDLIDAARIPHNALRVGETVLKRRTFAVEDAAVRSLQALYLSAYRDLRDVMDAQAVSVGTVTGRATLIHAATQRVERLKRDVLALVERYAKAALVGNYYGRLWLLDVATRDDVRVNLVPLTSNALREDLYSDLIRELLGDEWRAQYALELDDLTLAIRRAIGGGLLDGDSMDAISRRVRDAMGVQTDRRRGRIGSAERKGYRANFNRVQSLTRTVVQTVGNRGAVAAYRANSDILDGYEWLTAKDERVCPDCLGMDGRVFSFKSRKLPPKHPQCRCTCIPVIKPDALERPTAAPRRTLAQWARGYGMDKELADFLVPKVA